MRRFVIISLVLFVNFIVQSSLFQYIEIYNVKPNTALIIIVSYAILRGDIEGSIVGFFAGLLQDIFSARLIGVSALFGLLIGYFCGKPFKDFYKENYLLPIVLTFFSSMLYEFLFYVTNYFFRAELDIGFYFSKVILPTTIYNVLLCVLIYIVVYAINRNIELHERSKKSSF